MKSKSPLLLSTYYFLLLFGFLLFACHKAPPISSHKPVPALTITQLSAYSQVRAERNGKTEFFDAAFKIVAPNQLYLNLLDDLGEVRLRLVADGIQITYQEGPTAPIQQISQDDESLKKILHLPLSIEEFVLRMLDTQNPTYEKRDPPKKYKYRVFYRQYSKDSTKAYPHQIEWEFRKPRIKFLMNLSEIEID
jgi:hypothetical protein